MSLSAQAGARRKFDNTVDNAPYGMGLNAIEIEFYFPKEAAAV